MNRVTFDRSFSAAHRLHNDPGKCGNVHGHNYRARVVVASDEPLTEQGFVVPFDVVKEVVDGYDHALILADADPLLPVLEGLPIRVRVVSGPPSTERLAFRLANEVLDRLDGLYVVDVALRETDSIEASASVRST